MPRVSVIIPTFNRADLLPDTIQSVLSQTFEDFEIIVVDDGSTDNTGEVVGGIQDRRLIYLRQQHSGLPAVARNTGLRHVRGEYIAFIDSDDLWFKHKLARQVHYMDLNSEVALTYTNSYRFTDDPKQCDPKPIVKSKLATTGHSFKQLYGNPIIPNLTVMIRSSIIDEIGVFDEDRRLKACEDYEYWLRIAYRYPIGYLDEVLAKYRQHSAGISKTILAINRANLVLVAKLDQLYPDFVARHPDKRQRWLSKIHYALGRTLLRADRVTEARQHFRESWKHQPQSVALLFWAVSFCGQQLYRRLDGLKRKLRMVI